MTSKNGDPNLQGHVCILGTENQDCLKEPIQDKGKKSLEAFMADKRLCTRRALLSSDVQLPSLPYLSPKLRLGDTSRHFYKKCA